MKLKILLSMFPLICCGVLQAKQVEQLCFYEDRQFQGNVECHDIVVEANKLRDGGYYVLLTSYMSRNVSSMKILNYDQNSKYDYIAFNDIPTNGGTHWSAAQFGGHSIPHMGTSGMDDNITYVEMRISRPNDDMRICFYRDSYYYVLNECHEVRINGKTSGYLESYSQLHSYKVFGPLIRASGQFTMPGSDFNIKIKEFNNPGFYVNSSRPLDPDMRSKRHAGYFEVDFNVDIAPPSEASSSNGACFYPDRYYRGTPKCTGISLTNYNDLSAIGMDNGVNSYYQTSPYFYQTAAIFTEKDFEGDALVLPFDHYQFPARFTNQVSSIATYRSFHQPPKPADALVCLHNPPGLVGNYQCFTNTGDYGSLASELNGTVGSLQINGNYIVTLYSQAGLKGDSTTFTSSTRWTSKGNPDFRGAKSVSIKPAFLEAERSGSKQPRPPGRPGTPY